MHKQIDKTLLLVYFFFTFSCQEKNNKILTRQANLKKTSTKSNILY